MFCCALVLSLTNFVLVSRGAILFLVPLILIEKTNSSEPLKKSHDFELDDS